MLVKRLPSGIYIREGTYDSRTAQEVNRSYGWMELKDKNVLDVGACFGSFSTHAMRSGAAHVTSVEPDPGNFDLLKKNMAKYKHKQLINAAVCSKQLMMGAKTVTLWKTTTGKSHGNYSTTHFRGREGIEVPMVCFTELLEARPSVIKMDCEGCEYDLLLSHRLPGYVKQIALEIHLNKKGWRDGWFRLLELFEDWECVKEPYDTGKNWATVGGWRR